MKTLMQSVVTVAFVGWCTGASAQSPLTCELAGSFTGGGAKKVYTAKSTLRCPADGDVVEIQEMTADVRVAGAAAKVTLNWNYVFRRKPSRGAVMLEVYGGGTLLKSCPTSILNNDFSDTASASDSAECDLPADAYKQIDRFVVRVKGVYR
jgi:hypothetical protein